MILFKLSHSILLLYILVFILITSSCISHASAERILFLLPISSKSMTNVFEPLAKGLTDRGHHLKIITPTQFNIDTKNVTQLIPISTEDYVQDYPEPFETRRKNKLFSLSVPFLTKNCHKIYQNSEFMKIVNETFDLMIVNVFFHDCFAGVMHKIGSPIVFVGSLPVPSHMTMEMFGNHFPSSTVPFIGSKDISGTMTFTQRVKNFLYNLHYAVMLDNLWRPPMMVINKQYMGQEIPSILEVYKKQGSLLLMNSHYAINGPRPLVPAVVEIGGIHCRPARPLDKELEDFVSGTEHGFILFSLGSIVKATSMPEQVRRAFVQTFSKLNERVIWKWEKDEGMPDLPPNVKLVKWVPQQDLLGHPNIRLFITHGGLLSTEEAVYHGVPVLGLPVFVDQDANMRQAEILGFGVKGEILDLTEAKLTNLVRRILDEPLYIKKAKELSNVFRDQPETSLERAIFWTEYILRHKGAYHLRSAALNLNWIQYHCLDVVFFLAVISITFFLFVYYVVNFLLRLVFWVLSLYSSSDVTSLRKGVPKKKKY